MSSSLEFFFSGAINMKENNEKKINNERKADERNVIL